MCVALDPARETRLGVFGKAGATSPRLEAGAAIGYRRRLTPYARFVDVPYSDRRMKAAAEVRHSVPLEILVVDDDQATRLSLAYALEDANHRVTQASDGEEAIALVSERTFDVGILDIRLPKLDGLSVFRRLRQKSPSTSVILMTAFATVPDAVASLREGAYDYVTKPFDAEEFSLRVIGHIAEHRALRQELEEARKLVASREAGSPIIGQAPSMVKLVERINTVAQSGAPVLIRGESGTGKDLIAHTLHARSPRKSGPFVMVNCAAFPESLVEPEIFGEDRTGDGGRKAEGRLEMADGGTIYFDEISDLPLSAQANLLRVLDEGVVWPLGAKSARPVDVRVIASTRRDLKERVARGEFREELYFRINVVDLDIPPLRDRRADMPLLLAHFLRRFYPGRVPPGMTPRAWSALTEHPFPGNVREFAHAIERAAVLSHGREIDVEHLPPDVAEAPSGQREIAFPRLQDALRDFERNHILRAIHASGGDKTRAADLLGISRRTLSERLKFHGISESLTAVR